MARTPQARSVLPLLAVVASLLGPMTAAAAGEVIHRCAGLVATIVGTSGNDVIEGTAGDDVIVGLGGSDIIRGRAGNDTICGGRGADTIYGGSGADLLVGNRGGDLLHGGRGHDTLVGDTGFDGLSGGSGSDECRDGEYFRGCEQPLSVSFNPLRKTIPQMQAALASGRITSVGLVDFYLARIAAYDDRGPRLRAIIALNPYARTQAIALDAERQLVGPRGPLHGIPIVLKDNMGTIELPTTAGSLSLEGFIPEEDAFQVARLRAAGAIILAKANLHEFARNITTVSSLGGQTKNPYDLARNPGGSSGGTGAALAAEFAAVGMGTDTCGSIRIPAAHNNLYGLRPTMGLSSRAGIVPLSFTEDTAGPLARSVVDLATVLDATVGVDPDDPTTVFVDASYVAAVDPDGLEGKRIGVVDVLFDGSHAGVEATVRAALDEMEANGAVVVPVVIPNLNNLRGSAAVIFLREFRFAVDDYLDAHPGAPVGSLQEVFDSGMYHQAIHSALVSALAVETLDTPDYLDALERRDLVRDTIVEFMDDHDLDALAYPTITYPPSLIGPQQSGRNNCGTASVGGLPAIVVPAGFTSGLPVGLELMGRPFSEGTLIAIAAGYEANVDVRRLPKETPRLP
jgi:Asp-tRNA(Asn)/Glu-tRNA(Gln) amidotransferase A subunit family amidase